MIADMETLVDHGQTTGADTHPGADGDPEYASRHQRIVNSRLRRPLRIRDRVLHLRGL